MADRATRDAWDLSVRVAVGTGALRLVTSRETSMGDESFAVTTWGETEQEMAPVASEQRRAMFPEKPPRGVRDKFVVDVVPGSRFSALSDEESVNARLPLEGELHWETGTHEGVLPASVTTKVIEPLTVICWAPSRVIFPPEPKLTGPFTV